MLRSWIATGTQLAKSSGMAKVLLLNEEAEDGLLHQTLCELGYDVIASVRQEQGLVNEVLRLEPDIIIVITKAPDEAMFVSLSGIASSCPRPVLIFAKSGTRELIRRAVDSGVSAYVVDGWAPNRITPIIEAATARFEAYEGLRKELASAHTKLTERKLVEKAKGIVMQQRKLTEDQAYTALRKMAMDQNLALSEVARRVIAVAQLLA
jgi:response regulator NasT